MRPALVFDLAWILSAGFLLTTFSSDLLAQTATPREKPSVFRVKYLADSTVYVDAGRNAGLQEGMKLSVIEPPPDNAVTDGIRFRGYPHVAELNVVSVADASAVCDVLSSSGELRVGQFAILAPASSEERHLAETARDTDNYPIVVAFTSGDPADEELRATKVEGNLAESPIGVMRARVG